MISLTSTTVSASLPNFMSQKVLAQSNALSVSETRLLHCKVSLHFPFPLQSMLFDNSEFSNILRIGNSVFVRAGRKESTPLIQMNFAATTPFPVSCDKSNKGPIW